MTSSYIAVVHEMQHPVLFVRHQTRRQLLRAEMNVQKLLEAYLRGVVQAVPWSLMEVDCLRLDWNPSDRTR
jgi:hypothetical protein